MGIRALCVGIALPRSLGSVSVARTEPGVTLTQLRWQEAHYPNVKRALEYLISHANQPHHDIITDVFNSKYPDEVFKTKTQRYVFEALCKEIGVEYKNIDGR